jgi:macrolide transport system ATP-binding/permease protein
MRLEHWWFQLPLRLRSILFRGRVERELEDELQFHLDHKIEAGVASGLSREEARLAALRDMDGLEQRKEEMREMRGVHWFTDFVDDLRFAVRSLRRSSGLAWFVVFTMALGIGMTVAPFSMVDALIFRPYPVTDPSRVVTLLSTSRDNAYDQFSYREYLDIREKTTSYDGVIANTVPVPVGFSAEPGATPRVRIGMMVSGNYFQVLGVEPQLGRAFRLDEDQVPDRDAVVVLGRDFWNVEFARDPSVVGKTIRLNGREFVVIGVAPESFPGLQIFARPDLYMPLATARVFSTDRSKNFFEDRDDRELTLRGRLKTGASLAQARSELGVLARDFEREYPEFNRNRGAAVRTQFEMRTRGDDINWKFGIIFSILALAVLLVACTNVAGLLLSRAGSRTREIAVRLALGAGRSRVIRMLLTESLILSILGGLGGVLIGYAVLELLQTFTIPTSLPVTIPFRLDGRVLLASLVLSVVSAVLCGLPPALQSTRADLVQGLKTADVDAPGRRRFWGRNLLVVAQVATSLMLLTASFLMFRGFRQTLGEASEFARVAQDRVLIAAFDPRLMQYDAAQTERFYQQLVERMREVPGVQNAALTQNPPLGLDGFRAVAFVPDGVDMPPDRETFTSAMDTIDEGYFETMGVPIVRGRGFLASDTDESPRVAVVNQQLANHYWPGSDAIGKRLWLDGLSGTPVEVVGVAQTITYTDTGERPVDFVYLPLTQRPRARMVLLVRSNGDPLQLVEPLKDVVRTLDPNMPIVETRSYRDLYRYSAVEGPAVAIKLVSTMGAMALLLAIGGLYGLIAFNVSRRTREIGIRMAIGAAPSQVLRMVMHKGMVLVGVGTAIGLAMGFGLEKAMNSMLFNAGGIDLWVYAVVVPAMFLVTMLAAFVPALKASRIHPTEALRYE